MVNPAIKGLSALPVIGRAFQSKQVETVIPGQDAGWMSLSSGLHSAAANPRKLSTLLGTYGGTDDSVTWVYACTQLIMAEMASYPYDVMTEQDKIVPGPRIPPDLKALLDEPNEDMTYFDLIEFMSMDLELAGNSYWLMDQPNLIGQPMALMRLRPEFVRIAVNDAGRVVGYLYTVQGYATPIPFNRDEVMHFKTPHPRNEYYGMGTVEAIQRALETDLAITDHVIGFFSEGARISGVLTTNMMSEQQFDRFKRQFYEEYAGNANAHKILIAENGTKFDPITATPAGTGVVQLRAGSKDEILSAFGIHEFLLGGAEQAGIFKMEEAQNILSRHMVPKARRISLQITRELVRLWRMHFRINATFAEPKSTRVRRAREMLAAGASINESRHEMDLPPFTEDWADRPIMPQGFAPFGYMLPGGQPVTMPVSSGPSPIRGNQSPLSAAVENMKALTAPFVFPEGFEQLGVIDPKEASREDVEAMLSHQADAYAAGVKAYGKVIDEFFSKQRARVLKKMGSFDSGNGSRRFTNTRRKIPKKDLSIGSIWDGDGENDELRDAYYEVMDEVAKQALRSPLIEMVYAADSPFGREMRKRLGKNVVGINETTRSKIAEMIALGVRRSYSVQQIAQGYAEENYPGVLGVFDEASRSRAVTISRTETAYAVNAATLLGYAARDVNRVEVFDGTEFDEACQEANGSVWEIDYALGHLISHPNCVRAFAPIH